MLFVVVGVVVPHRANIKQTAEKKRQEEQEKWERENAEPFKMKRFKEVETKVFNEQAKPVSYVKGRS